MPGSPGKYVSLGLACIWALAGCGRPYDKDHLAGRFAGTSGQTQSTAAADLSERYTQLVQTVGTLREENRQLAQENQILKRQVEQLQSELAKTQTELAESNSLLMEMLAELNNWKSDVLGFRDEMRQAAQAQLEALEKILEALGAGLVEGHQEQQGGSAGTQQ